MSKYTKYLSDLSRPKKVAMQIVADSGSLVLAFICALLLRLESVALLGKPAVWSAIVATALVTLLTFQYLGLYQSFVRFVTGKILIIISQGALVGAVVLYTTGWILESGIPRSVPIIFGLFVVLFAGGIRFLVRTYFRNPARYAKLPAIIYGAGDSGRQLQNSLFYGRDYDPVAFVDDNPNLQGLSMGGLRVSAPGQIPHLVRETGAHIVLLAIPSIGRARRREIINDLKDLQIEIKTIPSLFELIEGKAKISELRTLTPEDLLGRDPIEPNDALLAKNITGRVVMVTGAGGSIGSELCRQILIQKPRALVLFDVSEFSIYNLEIELSASAARLRPSIEVFPILGSVQNASVVEDAIKAFGVQTIYHAAAYKHVPLIEDNVVEAIRNNVFGTLAVAAVAQKLEVENFILISTDKAVRPTNVMGASKRIAELICQAYARDSSRTVFSMVRFGNVLGSSGSVIPRFRAQIEDGGPVTVTHSDITRYFMTIPEAAQLVIQAGAMGKGGDVFVLDMGEPVKIMNVALEMVRLYGLVPYIVDHPSQVFPEKGDIPICVTGLRKGEKLYEELLIGNNPSQTLHPRIMTASEIALPMEELLPALDRLRQACENIDLSKIIEILHELPLDYTPGGAGIAPWKMRAEEEGQSEMAKTVSARA
jgi:FlaA1/EpsC-like NDP-sugar epimerase